MKKLCYFLILTLILLITIISASLAEEIKVGVVVRGLTSDSNSIAAMALQEYGQEKGWEVVLADCEEYTERMSGYMLDFIAMGVDAIVCICGDPQFIDESVEAAEKAGIPVFLEDIPNIRNTVVNVTSNNWEMGATLGSQVVDRVMKNTNGEGGDIVIIGMPDFFVLRVREEMCKAIFDSAETPNINLLDYQIINAANWQDESYETARIMLTKYGDRIKAIIGSFDGNSWGAARAIADAGYTKDQIFSIGIDGSEQSYDLIRRGTPFVGTVAQDFAGWSRMVVDFIDKIVVEGKDPDKVVPTTKIVYTPYKFIDESNVPAAGESVIFSR
jgi:ribose transport system substrate-binding protein